MWNTNTENLRLRTEPQLKINSQGEIFKMLNTNTKNLRSRIEPQLKIKISELQSKTKQNVDSVMTVQDAIEQNETNEKIDSQREISELQSETQQNVDSLMTVQDAIKQDERVDMLVRMRWTIERLYDNITKGEPMANSIDYMFFMTYYNEIKQNDNDLRKLKSEIWKDFFLDFRKAYLREKIFNNLRSDFPEEKKYLFIKDYINEFKGIKADLSYIFEKCKTEEEKKLLLSFFER